MRIARFLIAGQHQPLGELLALAAPVSAGMVVSTLVSARRLAGLRVVESLR